MMALVKHHHHHRIKQLPAPPLPEGTRMYAFQDFANVFIFAALLIVHWGVLPCTWAYTLHCSVHLTLCPTPVLRYDLFVSFCPSAGRRVLPNALFIYFYFVIITFCPSAEVCSKLCTFCLFVFLFFNFWSYLGKTLRAGIHGVASVAVFQFPNFRPERLPKVTEIKRLSE